MRPPARRRSSAAAALTGAAPGVRRQASPGRHRAEFDAIVLLGDLVPVAGGGFGSVAGEDVLAHRPLILETPAPLRVAPGEAVAMNAQTKVVVDGFLLDGNRGGRLDGDAENDLV